VAAVHGGVDDYRAAHPSRAVLAVEVAESSLDIDRHRKGQPLRQRRPWRTTGSSTSSTASSSCVATQPRIDTTTPDVAITVPLYQRPIDNETREDHISRQSTRPPTAQ